MKMIYSIHRKSSAKPVQHRGCGMAVIFFFITICLCSCKKYLEIPPPIHQVTSETVFTDDATALSAVSGLYGQVMVSNLFFANGAMSVYAGMSADELNTSFTSPEIVAFSSNSLQSTNSIISTAFWNRAYSHIYQANLCLEGLESSSGLSSDLKKQLQGEVLFLRGFFYFYLANVFGDVPLLTSTRYQENARAGRSNVAVVYGQVVQDLKTALTLLVPSYPSPNRTRVNLHAAQALLARAHLYQGNWTEAEAVASLVIQSGTYSLVTDLSKVFLIASNEVILQFAPILSLINSVEGFSFIPSAFNLLAKPSYPMSSMLVGAFVAPDQRRNAWVGSRTIGAETFYYPLKYKVRSSTTAPTEYSIVIRLAEVYLIRAEARARMDQLSGSLQDVNVIRGRAGLPSLSNLDKTALLDAIEKERRIELFSEWGHRWLDLKRTGRAGAVLGPLKPDWQDTDVLYPIPQTELQRNLQLVQNPGY